VEAGVVGVPHDERGEVVKAFVETDEDPNEALEDDIQGFVREELSKHEYPRRIEFVDVVPMTPDGKIQRSKLRDREDDA